MNRRLGDLLVEAKVLTAKELAGRLARAVTIGEERTEADLLATAIAHERALAAVLAKTTGSPAAVMSECVLDALALGLIPKVIAEKHKALPILVDAETISVAFSDPSPGAIVDQIAFASGRRVVPYVAVPHILQSMLLPAYEARARGDATFAGKGAKPGGAHLEAVREVGEQNAATPFLLELLPLDEELTPAAPKTLPARTVPESFPVLRHRDMPTPIGMQRPTGRLAVVVEDDEAIRHLITRTLEADGFVVRQGATGEDAVRILREVQPTIIILDAMLPGVHGFEICARAKQSDVFKDVPIIMVSAVYRGWEHAREIQEVHGADAFVEKPFDVHYLRKLVATLLGSELQRAPIAPQTAGELKAIRARYEQAFVFGDTAGATMALQQWLAVDPFDPLAHLEAGNLHMQQGNLPWAMQSYETATIYDSKLFPAMLNLATVAEKLGFWRKARRVWQRAAALAPDEKMRAEIVAHVHALEG
jgi:DNA-binding response OmpR family regulator